jgi:threonine/homoserine/homoserine lactone efflux protein
VRNLSASRSARHPGARSGALPQGSRPDHYALRMPVNFVAFAGVASLTIMTPGPDTALILRNTIAGGRVAGLANVGGLAVGVAVWSAATVAGLTAVLLAVSPLYAFIRYAGAIYLTFLGLQALRAAFRGSAPAPVARKDGGVAPRAAFRQGLISDLGNPKLGAFMTSLLPQFVGGDGSPALQLATLCLMFEAMALGWFLFYVLAVSKAAHMFARPRVRRGLDAMTGTVFLGFGLRLATERR